MAGFLSKKQYAAIAPKAFAMKLLNERCRESSIWAMFLSSSLTVIFLAVHQKTCRIRLPNRKFQ